MLIDPLSDVLSLLKPRSYVSGGFSAAGDWSIQFTRNDGIKCYAVVSGECWLSVEGVLEPVRLTKGDGFLLPNGRPFRLASDLKLAPTDAATVYAAKREGGFVTCNGGGELLIVGSYFALAGSHANILLKMLPPIVHLRKKSDQAALRWAVERMMEELRSPQPGSFLVAQHLAHMMLVQALRLYMLDGATAGVGWLFALVDKQMSLAINSMHHDPARRWTLDALALCAGMSRSRFARKFKETVGMTAMEYLTRWRMLLAGDRLANSSDPISIIAPALGYESESAFSAAFKRVMGCSPRQYSLVESPNSLTVGEKGKIPAANRST
ncbi:AraC family transcriptional regulator [Asticcacaulis benevestitus]|uniref:AraC family transcriptional regulator n=1 Tax=Asticcacaulis benevestitus TaxID=347481 RepID=UPI00039F655A|nr:AraC family transcriptional regulator [Asticcacaulis benevestitus]